jgi:hypothetical protein
MTTVFYAKSPAGTLGYTIVAGTPLAVPASARAFSYHGIRFASFTQAGRTVVTWRRDGHTCVLSGDRAGIRTLRELAAWQA